MVDVAGTKEPVRVTYSDGFDGLPVPSPDGKQLAWTSSRGGGRRARSFWRSGITRRRSRRSRPPRTALRRREDEGRTIGPNRRSTAAPHGPRHRSSSRSALAASLAVAQSRGAGRVATRTHVETLASDGFEGRLGRVRRASAWRPTTSRRADAHRRAAAARAEGLLRAVRLHGGHKDGGLDAVGDAPPAATPQAFSSTRRQVQALSFSDNAEVSGSVVFAGYGLVVPDSRRTSATTATPRLDVKDKVVAGAPLLPRGRRPEDAIDPRALLRSALQGDGGAAARRQGAARASPARDRRTPARRFR